MDDSRGYQFEGIFLSFFEILCILLELKLVWASHYIYGVLVGNLNFYRC